MSFRRVPDGWDASPAFRFALRTHELGEIDAFAAESTNRGPPYLCSGYVEAQSGFVVRIVCRSSNKSDIYHSLSGTEPRCHTPADTA